MKYKLGEKVFNKQRQTAGVITYCFTNSAGVGYYVQDDVNTFACNEQDIESLYSPDTIFKEII